MLGLRCCVPLLWCPVTMRSMFGSLHAVDSTDILTNGPQINIVEFDRSHGGAQ